MLLASFAALLISPWTVFAVEPKAIGFNFVKEKRSPSIIARRDGTVPVALDNGRILYLLDISVGTPPQKVRGMFFVNLVLCESLCRSEYFRLNHH